MKNQGKSGRYSRRKSGKILPEFSAPAYLFILIFLFLMTTFLPLTGFSLLHSWIILAALILFVHMISESSRSHDSLLLSLPVIYLSAALLDLILFTGKLNFPQSWSGSYELQFRLASSLTESTGVLFAFILMKKNIPFRIGRFFYFLVPLIFILIILLDQFPKVLSGSHRISIFSYTLVLIILIVFVINFRLLGKFKNRDNDYQYSHIAVSFIFSFLSAGTYLFQIQVMQTVSLIFEAAAYHQLWKAFLFRESAASPVAISNRDESLFNEQYYMTQTLSAVQDGMFRYYPDRQTMDVSKVWQDMTGYIFEDFTVSNPMLRKLFPDLEYEKLTKDLDISYESSSSLTEEFKMIHQDGEPRWVLVRGRMGIDQMGNPCFIGMMTDITWKKRIEQELIIAKERAEESDKLKTTFLANISHEIRTPLNVILGFTGLILKDLPEDEKSDERMKYLELVRQSSNQLISIISDIIDLSRIENEKINLQYQPVSIHNFFTNIQTVYRKLMDDRGKQDIRLIWVIPGEIAGELFITTDIERFHQIWQNLLNNSMKFTEYGQIRFGVESVDTLNNHITFFVEDTGPGISHDKHRIVFERFRQGEEGFARRYGGSGLGLTITRELLHLMGGRISLDNNYSRGARFLFTLPEHRE